MMDDKTRQMEDEMIRFEAELGSQIMTTSRPVIGANTYNQVARQLEQHELPASPVVAAAPTLPYPPVSSIISFPPPPPPHQIVKPNAVPITTYSSSDQINSPFIASIIGSLSSLNSLSNTMIHPDRMSSKISESDTKKWKAKGVSTAAELAISQGKASSIMANANIEGNRLKGKVGKNKKVIRMAGGQIWEDSSLMDWDEDDFRIFCGDLGNDVTDDMLIRVFANYPSFQKAKVIRDKRTNKSKGFGFVSFKDPQDFIKAMKEINGRYVGSRPIKLRKSSWKQRNLDTVRRKEKEKQSLIGFLTGQ